MLRTFNNLKNSNEIEQPELTCDVCGKPAIGVACIPGVPMSVAYCRECLEANAHPWWALVANTICINGLENADDGWKGMVYDTCKRLHKTLEEFNKEVARGIKEMELELAENEAREINGERNDLEKDKTES